MPTPRHLFSTLALFSLLLAPLPGQEENGSPRALFQEAYENRYTFPAFDGLEATFVYHDEGDERIHAGTMAVDAEGEVRIEIDDPEIHRWIQRAIVSTIEHRRTASFKEAHAESIFERLDDDPAFPGVRLRNTTGDRAEYGIVDGRFVRIVRATGPHDFRIETLESRVVEEGRYLPTRYRIAIGDTGHTIETAIELVRIGGLWLPERIESTETQTEGVRVRHRRIAWTEPNTADPERLAADVQFLASDALRGRFSGSYGERIASLYLARALEEVGVEPAGDDGTWFQAFGRRLYEGPGRSNRLVVRTARGKRTIEAGREFAPMALSQHGTYEGEIVFVGYGIVAPEYDYDDYAGIDVRGRVVLFLRGTPRGDRTEGPFTAEGDQRFGSLLAKARTAREKGAVAIVVANDPRVASGENDRPILPTLAGGVSGPIVPAASVSTRLARTLLSDGGLDLDEVQAGIDRDLQPASASLEGVALRLVSDVRWNERDLRNVVGILPGTDPSVRDEVVVVGAHYDHLGMGYHGSLAARPGEIHNGADDNASGTSVVLEIARLLAENPPRRSIVFLAFSGEELGLLGSAHYVEHPAVPLEKTVAMINLDMIGRFDGKAIQIGGVGTGEGLEDLVGRLEARFDFEASRQKSGYGPSDHTSFYTRKVPVLFFFTGAHDDYHKPSDDTDQIDPNRLAQVTRIVRSAVRDIADRTERPAYLVTAPPKGPTRRGPRVRFGIIPDYVGQGDGLRLSGVAPGGPAERAGIAAGDTVVRFGRFEIEDIYGLMEALSAHSPGDRVEVVVQRDDREETFEVTLEAPGR